MAKVLNPLQSSEARGKVGGAVYNTTRGTRYVKQCTAPSQPRTPRQLLVRSITTEQTRRWQTLTQPQRDQWTVYAQNHTELDWTGQPYRLTALNWFVRCNMRLKDTGKSVIDVPPTDPAPSPVVGFALAKTGADLTATWTTPITGTDVVDTFIIGPISRGVAGKIERARHWFYMAPNTPQPVKLVEGVPKGRWIVWARVLGGATGLASTWSKSTFDIT